MTTTHDAPADTGKGAQEWLTGDRTFTWFTPARRKASEYELYTIGNQSNPDHWLHVGWPVRFDDGRPPWSDDASRVRTTRWQAYRDPAALWQRPYVSGTNQDQQALARLVPVLAQGSLANASTTWTKEILGRTYAAWPFVEYGLFLSLAYGVRQAMSDTVQFTVVFQAADRLRLLQDIVYHLDALTEASGFSDAGARDAWMSDPTLVPIRELVEHIIDSDDWVEALVVGTLIFEPLVGHLAKTELFSHRAALVGDATTPAVLASSVRDSARHVASVQALVQLVCADPDTGAANAEVIRDWVGHWGPQVEAAGQAFLAGFGAAGVDEVETSRAFSRAQAHQRQALEGAGVTA